MAKADGGELIARVMRENRVKYCFAINGGHLFPILGQLRNHDIKLIHMRHEQATAYAADAYARTSGEVGVCMVTAGCGLTNAVTGLCVAGLTNSAVVCISGQHPNTEDHLGSFQEAYGSEVVDSFSKFTKRVTDWSTIQFDLRSAFREAISPPQGVALFEIPQNILYHHEEDSGQRKGAREFTMDDVRSAGDPSKIDRALEMLVAAERPLIACGDGVFWSQAGAEMREFVELTNIPIYARRAGQGVVSEEHPLAIRGAFKKPFTGGADVVRRNRLPLLERRAFRAAADLDRQGQVHPDRSDADANRMAGQRGPADGRRSEDRAAADDQAHQGTQARLLEEQNFAVGQAGLGDASALRQSIKEQNAKVSKNQPIHPARLCEDLITVLDKNATTIIDSFTLSGWMSRAFTCRFMGQVVDAGPLAPVGHGVGMGIGAQLARPGQQVVVISGDGGLGIGGWDMETAARYKLPVITVLWNNSSWGPNFDQMPGLKGRTDPFNMLPNIRYDKIFAEMGCHGEQVETNEQIKPALERAFKSGKPALINVIGDVAVGNATLGGNLLGSTGSN